MNRSKPPLTTDLVLIGGGHAHVHVLKMLGMQTRDVLERLGVQVTVISSVRHTPYSGMLPGYLAGHYTYDEIHLDVGKLTRLCPGGRFIHASATQITYQQKSSNNGGGGGVVMCDDSRPPIRYDILSIDIGSSPSHAPASTIPVKPIASFCHQYEAILADVRAHILATSTAAAGGTIGSRRKYRACIVGGGAGGVELALAFYHRIMTEDFSKASALASDWLELHIITRSALLDSHGRMFRHIFVDILKQRGIHVLEHTTVDRVEAGIDDDGKRCHTVFVHDTHDDPQQQQQQQPPPRRPIVMDACFWCVSARGADWLSTNTPFCTTDDNFLRVDQSYECAPGVFAAGDCCHMDKYPRPKAGVFAVRAGPILYENIIKRLKGESSLRRHVPQSVFLQLVSTGNQYAVASYHRFAFGAAWLWRVKDWLDRTWMAKYSTDLPDLVTMMEQMEQRQQQPQWRWSQRSNSGSLNAAAAAIRKSKGEDVFAAFQSNPMRCGGCGAKVGSSTLSRVLQAVQQRQQQRAIALGLPPPPAIEYDDAAVTVLPNAVNHGTANGNDSNGNKTEQAIIQTIDFFREMVNDPFVFGKVAAIHSLSDVHAMGASAQTALALAVAPFAADDSITESTLLHLLSGVSDVLQDENIRLVGGHTCEGHELSCGLSVQGFTSDRTTLLTKKGGKIGDKIVLTKPIGTGALFAAEMRGQCKGDYVGEAIESMLKSNLAAGQVASEFSKSVHACTDVTGFGLIGHLLEMLTANDSHPGQDPINAVLNVQHIKFLKGGLAASRQNIFSSLQPQNARNRRAVRSHAQAAHEFAVQYPLLFDPQTAGGLLLFVAGDRCDEFVQVLQHKGVDATAIGSLEERHEPKTYERSDDDPLLACSFDANSSTVDRIRIDSSLTTT